MPENTFGEITFDEINIDHATNLTLIHTNAFSAINLRLTILIIELTQLKSLPPNYDIFTAISHMIQINSVYIQYCEISEIPDNAFRPLNGTQTNFTTLYLGFNKITKIGNNAFQYLVSLSTIVLYNNPINHVSENAFNMLRKSETLLDINLNNCPLNSSSFEIGSFSNLKRPTKIQFTSNNVTHLDQHVFEPFFGYSKQNTLTLDRIDCNDCRSVWLLNKYSTQLSDLKCSNNNTFSDKRNFPNCV